MNDRAALLLVFYETLVRELGPSRWWPAETPFEVAVGAVLTQNTNWANVERAIANLRREGVLEPEALYALDEARLAELIRPAGYFRLKAGRLRNLLVFLEEQCSLRIEGLRGRDMDSLRGELLAVKGVGPETADSILLYALEMPSFVVDAYTRRIVSRHSLLDEGVSYHDLRKFFMDVLPRDVNLYNEFHALLVRAGNHWCGKKRGNCGECPLSVFLEKQ